ncbi:NlpC/P60 family protein [Frondihabitans sp. PhB188]|uniref:C40 family peptidase n=1 Tax=Frondihabitans sp. PhB188 TaxID=2485200 RepID=UPI000F48186A|nr:C40 family peptidase [Frondihabitans sp. PhB188]ROQ40084.1 NlpC/P60 family protein [Frondihabitans sp. PhB188]
MHTIDPTPEPRTTGPSVEVRIAAEPKRSGRRAAVASSASALAGAPFSIDPVISPRRAARAAREAAAAAELMSGSASDPAPVSPVVAAAPVSPIVAPAAAVAPAPVSPVVAPAAVAPVAPAATTAPLPLSGLAASIPSSVVAGRRQTFVPSAVEPTGRSRVVVSRPAQRPAIAAPAGRRGARIALAARRGAIVGVVCGILATSVLPVLKSAQTAAYASPTGTTTVVAAGSQTYDVATGVLNTVSGRDSYGATSVVDYEVSAIAARQKLGIYEWTGPTAADYLAKPKYAKLDRAEVYQVALQYLGTPYVHGGDTPGSFDCSGLIMYVYAQFGISLPHYVPSQDAAGTTISQSEAVPGDLVVFDSDDHDGIYAGNGMILDAPKPGGYVSVRPIWDAPHHFVRIAG